MITFEIREDRVFFHCGISTHDILVMNLNSAISWRERVDGSLHQIAIARDEWQLIPLLPALREARKACIKKGLITIPHYTFEIVDEP